MAVKPKPDQLQILIDAGLELIPLHQWDAISSKGKSAGKAPIGRDWRNTPALTLDEATAHMAEGGNIGIRLPAWLLIIDADPRNYEDDDKPPTRLREQYDVPLDKTAQTITGGGGYHVFFRLPDDVAESIAKGEQRVLNQLPDLQGVEFKGYGRQVVAPGSIHPDTQDEYGLDDDTLNLEVMDIVDAPPKLVAAVVRDTNQNSVIPGAQLYTTAQLQETLAQLDPTDFKGHDKWLEFMMACHAATQGEGLDESVTWSTSDPDYEHHGSDIAYRWDTLDADKTDGISHPTFRKVVEDHGGTVPMDREAFAEINADEDAVTELGIVPFGVSGDNEVRASVQRSGKETDTYQTGVAVVLHEMKDALGPSRNLMTGEIEFRGDWTPWEHLPELMAIRTLNDRTLGLLCLYLLEARGIELSKANLADALEQAADLNSYHPVHQYLDELTWDGIERADNLLTNYFGGVDTPLNRALSRLILVAAVRRARKPGCKFDLVTVLVGNQGIGKSSALERLCPTTDWFSDETLDFGRDPEKAAITNSRASLERLKAFLSRTVDRFRRPYDRFPTASPRSFIMVGTTNQEAFLINITGNRRFAPIRVDSMDLEGIARDRDQPWAEAVQLEPDFGSLNLPPELWDEAAISSNEFAHDHPYHGRLQDVLNGDERGLCDETGEIGIERDDEGKVIRAHSSALLDAIGEMNRKPRDPGPGRELRNVMAASFPELHYKQLKLEERGAKGYERL